MLGVANGRCTKLRNLLELAIFRLASVSPFWHPIMNGRVRQSDHNTIRPPMNWHDIPEDRLAAWREVFAASREGISLTAPCPVCSATTLHHYFSRPHPFSSPELHPGFLGRCGLWEWCSSCRSYAHYSAAHPDWWHCTLAVDESILIPQPEAIEQALINMNQNFAEPSGAVNDLPSAPSNHR